MQLIRKIIFDFRIICKSVGVGIRIYTLWENNTVGFVKLLSKNMNFLFKIQQKSWIEYYKKIEKGFADNQMIKKFIKKLNYKNGNMLKLAMQLRPRSKAGNATYM